MPSNAFEKPKKMPGITSLCSNEYMIISFCVNKASFVKYPFQIPDCENVKMAYMHVCFLVILELSSLEL